MMIKDTRLRIATGLLAGVLSVIGTAQAQAHPAPAAATGYVCDGGQDLLVLRSSRAATVRLGDGSYHLARRRSGIGVRYGSARAALIVDGDTAVFVAEDRPTLRGCVETATFASLR